MLLTLHYAPVAQCPAAAAFLAGAEPLAWLRELSRWQLPPAGLACYVVPESVQSVRPAGLLVVFAEGTPPPPDLREPYGCTAGRLYLPTHATLRPAATEAELASRLLYEVQLLHPTIGLVGFEATDRLALADLLILPAPRPSSWALAHPGTPPVPPLHSVRVQPPSLAEVLDAAKVEVGTAPLTELPGQPAPPSPLAQTLDALKRGALRTGLAASQLLTQLASLGGVNAGAGSSAPGRGRPAAPTGPSPLERLTNYLAGNLADLERKRNNELERLLALFSQDMELALRFAIPLASPYAHRGTAAPGSQLGTRGTSFSLGGLGGGQRVDAWDTSAYDSQLRASYLRAAEQETAAGRPHKAAYIYAHLLGDYRTAAQTLACGGYHREAAVLYHEHLRDTLAAANTLEQGGLLPEALEIYQQINSHEKVGDLYQQLGQPARAVPPYERAVAVAQAGGNVELAARLLQHKLARPAEAEALLLHSWATAAEPNAHHLRLYLRLLAATRPAGLPAAVRALHQQHTPTRQHYALLEVLLETPPTEETLQAVVREIGFEILSAEAQAGHSNRLHLLKRLLPHDRLLPGDTSRYATGRRLPKL